MRYSNCRQLGPRPARNPSAMQRLPRGSVILFGTTIEGEFCIDTVFVVATSKAWSPAANAGLDVDEAVRTCVLDTFRAAAGSCGGDEARRGCHNGQHDGGGRSFTLYRGATFDDPVEDMYSFVPARRATHDDPRFARPPIDLPGVVNPKSHPVRTRCGPPTADRRRPQPLGDHSPPGARRESRPGRARADTRAPQRADADRHAEPGMRIRVLTCRRRDGSSTAAAQHTTTDAAVLDAVSGRSPPTTLTTQAVTGYRSSRVVDRCDGS